MTQVTTPCHGGVCMNANDPLNISGLAEVPAWVGEINPRSATCLSECSWSLKFG